MNDLAVRQNNLGPAQSLGLLLERMLADPKITAEKMKIVVDAVDKNVLRMREEAFNAAFARLAPKLPRIPKSGLVKDKSSGKLWDYAKIEKMHEHLVPLMAEEGFSIRFYERECTWDPKQTTHVGVLMHEAGHSVESPVTLPRDDGPGRNAVQSHGSSSSYGRRYSWRNVLNIVWEGEDIDGAHGKGMGQLTYDQADEIKSVVDYLAAGDRDKLKELIGLVAELGDAQSIEDIRQRAFARVIKVLNRKKAEKEKEKQ